MAYPDYYLLVRCTPRSPCKTARRYVNCTLRLALRHWPKYLGYAAHCTPWLWSRGHHVDSDCRGLSRFDFAQLHIGNMQSAGAVLLSFAAVLIAWWRGFRWLEQSDSLILWGTLGWLMVNSQLRFDWYSIDADWERWVVSLTPLTVPLSI